MTKNTSSGKWNESRKYTISGKKAYLQWMLSPFYDMKHSATGPLNDNGSFRQIINQLDMRWRRRVPLFIRRRPLNVDWPAWQ